ncbi:hypothetical protein BGZ95_008099 [Linnemannia exigua]|uniref:Uncharacterized protein n=1 Tax=Linnemannia exigua TaxID=604196 RepID=A0AAD4CZT3_9FUNG|nr:hypothetical protein BGZ95_008099 [Linnemannia exigua]
MTKIKALGQDRQAELARQGRKKSRIWMENEHDMMMTRLAVERGPDLPAERLVARVSTITSSGGSGGSSSAVSSSSSSSEGVVTGAGAEGVTELVGATPSESGMNVQQPLIQAQEQTLSQTQEQELVHLQLQHMQHSVVVLEPSELVLEPLADAAAAVIDESMMGSEEMPATIHVIA